VKVTYEVNNLMREKLRNATEYAQEGKDSRALWYLIELMGMIYEEIEVYDPYE